MIRIFHKEKKFLNKKISKNKLNSFWKWFWGIFLLLLLITGVWFLYRASFFKVNSFVFEGNRLNTNEEMKIALVSEMKKNTHLFDENHILFWFFSDREYNFSYPSVFQFIKINVDFLNRRVTIFGEEREIKYIVCNSKEEVCYGIDTNGIIFSKIPQINGSLILRIEDEFSTQMNLGEPYKSDISFLNNIIETQKFIFESGLSPIIIRIRNDSLREWEGVFVNGPTFYFSGFFVPHNIPHIIENIKKNSNFSSLTYIDFRVENKVFYK